VVFSEQSRRSIAFGGVFYQAALDCAQDHYWPADRLSWEAESPLRATQARHIEQLSRLLGLGIESRIRERIADVLAFSGLDHQEALLEYEQAAGLGGRGRAILLLLPKLAPGRYDRLLVAGQLAGLWGRAWCTDPQSGRRKCLPLKIGYRPTSFALSEPLEPP